MTTLFYKKEKGQHFFLQQKGQHFLKDRFNTIHSTIFLPILIRFPLIVEPASLIRFLEP